MEDCALKLEIDENGCVVTSEENAISAKRKLADDCTEGSSANKRAAADVKPEPNIDVFGDVQVKYEPTDSMDSWLDPLGATYCAATNPTNVQLEDVGASSQESRNEIPQNRKKMRCGRTTPQQYIKMLSFFQSTKGLAEGKYNALHGKFETKKKWCELACELNLLKGAQKTPEQWQVVWRDLKSRTCIKARELRKEKSRTGNLPLTYSDFSEVEQRVIEIIGKNYVEGSMEHNDSMPEEELEVDNQMGLQTTAPALGTSETSMDGNYTKDYLTGKIRDIMGVEHDATTAAKVSDQAVWNYYDEGSANNSVKEDPVSSLMIDEARQTSRRSSSTTKKQHSSENTNHSPRTCRIARCQRNGTAGEDYLEIARIQAETMTVLGNSAKITALAIEKIAEGLSKLGDAAAAEAANNARNVQAQEKLSEAFSKIGDTMANQTANCTKQLEVMEKMVVLLQNFLPNSH